MVLLKALSLVVLIVSACGLTYVVTSKDDDYAWLMNIFMPLGMISLVTCIGFMFS